MARLCPERRAVEHLQAVSARDPRLLTRCAVCTIGHGRRGWVQSLCQRSVCDETTIVRIAVLIRPSAAAPIHHHQLGLLTGSEHALRLCAASSPAGLQGCARPVAVQVACLQELCDFRNSAHLHGTFAREISPRVQVLQRLLGVTICSEMCHTTVFPRNIVVGVVHHSGIKALHRLLHAPQGAQAVATVAIRVRPVGPQRDAAVQVCQRILVPTQLGQRVTPVVQREHAFGVHGQCPCEICESVLILFQPEIGAPPIVRDVEAHFWRNNPAGVKAGKDVQGLLEASGVVMRHGPAVHNLVQRVEVRALPPQFLETVNVRVVQAAGTTAAAALRHQHHHRLPVGSSEPAH
mmetsp:Transcript_29486/g.74188  ORF Transcript_29486/g.74188 Transcript_29486/m.74188 type:complete len:349 (-) Transcript_29486:604-1650(-)